MSEFKYVCIPVRTEEEGIETAEDVIGAMMWNNDEHKRPQAWPYDNDNPIIVMDSPLLLEKQLAEARAEIERLKKLQQFATAINCAMLEADCDPEYLRGHECVAKHKLLSMFDLWRKKVRPRLPGFIDDEISQRDKLIEQMREAFERINGAAWRIKLAQGNSACSCESLNAADIIAWSSEHSKAALSAAERGEG